MSVIFLATILHGSVLEAARAENAAAAALARLEEAPRAAADMLRRAREAGADEAATSYDLGLATARAGDVASALNEYRRAIEAATRKGDKRVLAASWYNLGVLLARQGRLEEALEAFRNALKADPADADARFNHELVRRLLEEAKKKEQERRRKEQQLSKTLQELLRRLAELVKKQGELLASAWNTWPQKKPSPKAPGKKKTSWLKRMLSGVLPLKKALPPLSPDMTREDAAQWVLAAFFPQPARPAADMSRTEKTISEEAGRLAADFGKLAASLPQKNPLAEALSAAKEDIEKGAAAAGKAVPLFADSSGRACEPALDAEHRFLVALSRFQQPPRSKPRPREGGKKGKEDQEKQKGQPQKPQKGPSGQRQEKQGHEREEEEKKSKMQARPLTRQQALNLLKSLKEDDRRAVRALLLKRLPPVSVEVEKDW